jgi:hypothetical protein
MFSATCLKKNLASFILLIENPSEFTFRKKNIRTKHYLFQKPQNAGTWTGST